MQDFLTGTGLILLIIFVLGIFLWRLITMWFIGTREIIKEIRGLRQDIQQLRGFAGSGVVGQPPATTPTTPTLPAAGRPATPSTYTPSTPTYSPQQMSSTPPPGWTGPWDPSQWGGGQK